MDLIEIEKLMKLMQSYGFNQVEVEQAGHKVKLTQASPAAAVSMAPPAFMPPYALAGPMMQGPMATANTQSADTHDKASAGAKDRSKYKEIRSPFVGTFYSAATPGSDDFVAVGKRVKKGDTLCIVEAMKMMNEIEAEKDLVIVEMLVANESPVEYDQPLFLYE